MELADYPVMDIEQVRLDDLRARWRVRLGLGRGRRDMRGTRCSWRGRSLHLRCLNMNAVWMVMGRRFDSCSFVEIRGLDGCKTLA